MGQAEVRTQEPHLDSERGGRPQHSEEVLSGDAGPGTLTPSAWGPQQWLHLLQVPVFLDVLRAWTGAGGRRCTSCSLWPMTSNLTFLQFVSNLILFLYFTFMYYNTHFLLFYCFTFIILCNHRQRSTNAFFSMMARYINILL